MRKSKLISVRVPVDVLNRLDDLLKSERWIDRSKVVCSLLEIAADTLMSKQLDNLSNVSEYWGNPMLEMHMRFNVYGKEQTIDYVREE